MLSHLNHLIREGKQIDYYVCKYPRMVGAFFQCKNGSAPRSLLYSENIVEHIQSVINEHNNDLKQSNRHLYGTEKYIYKYN